MEARGIASSTQRRWSDREGPRGCVVPQRADAEGLGVDVGQQEVDVEARRANAELQLCRRGFRVTGFLNTCFRI